MDPGILVINAGSSSIKYAAFRSDGGVEPVLLGKGQIEGLGSAPHFIGKNEHGQVLGEQRWPRQTPCRPGSCGSYAFPDRVAGAQRG